MSETARLPLIFSLLAVLLGMLSMPGMANDQEISEYMLGSGDTVRIQVYGEPDLTVETQITDTGALSYPFLGEIRLLGMTVGGLQEFITQGLLGDYLIEPRVTVSIVRYRNFYVNGEVARPGGFPFQPGLTVRKAVSLAGGFTERASKDKIFVVSDNDSSQTPRRVPLDGSVKPGDIITVEQSFF